MGVDPRYFRPTEVELLVGDPAKAEKELGWKAKTSFNDLVKLMVDADLKIVEEKLKDETKSLAIQGAQKFKEVSTF